MMETNTAEDKRHEKDDLMKTDSNNSDMDEDKATPAIHTPWETAVQRLTNHVAKRLDYLLLQCDFPLSRFESVTNKKMEVVRTISVRNSSLAESAGLDTGPWVVTILSCPSSRRGGASKAEIEQRVVQDFFASVFAFMQPGQLYLCVVEPFLWTIGEKATRSMKFRYQLRPMNVIDFLMHHIGVQFHVYPGEALPETKNTAAALLSAIHDVTVFPRNYKLRLNKTLSGGWRYCTRGLPANNFSFKTPANGDVFSDSWWRQYQELVEGILTGILKECDDKMSKGGMRCNEDYVVSITPVNSAQSPFLYAIEEAPET